MQTLKKSPATKKQEHHSQHHYNSSKQKNTSIDLLQLFGERKNQMQNLVRQKNSRWSHKSSIYNRI